MSLAITDKSSAPGGKKSKPEPFVKPILYCVLTKIKKVIVKEEKQGPEMIQLKVQNIFLTLLFTIKILKRHENFVQLMSPQSSIN